MEDAKTSKLRQPSKIGRPCCTVPAKPALPRSPPKSSMTSMKPPYESRGRRVSLASGSKGGSDTSVVLTEDTDSFIIGDRVWVGGTKPGCIAYIGETQFAPGDWAGVVLDEPIGKNDGSVAGSRYFQCEPKRGIFSRLTRLTRYRLSEGMAMSPTSPMDTSYGNLNKSMSPSLNASTTSLASVTQKDLKLGDRVIISSSQGSKAGILRFVGTTGFAPGEWCGIELDDAIGKNDGSVNETRYFECRSKHGIFAPTHKVTLSPSSRRTSVMSVSHKPSGAAMNSSIRRFGGSRESLASVSSVGSTAASIASRRTTTSISARPSLRKSPPGQSSMQDQLKEKQQEIDILRKERDFERERISKAANQAENAELNALTLKEEFDKYREEMEQKVQDTEETLAKLLEDRNVLKAHLEEERQKSEDLLFRFEEESINKDDIEGINAVNEDKMKALEEKLIEEQGRVRHLEEESEKLRLAEEELTNLRTELSTLMSHEKSELQDIQNRNLCLEEAKITLETQMLERNDLITQHMSQIKELEARLKVQDEDSAAQKALESDLKKNYDEVVEQLTEKSALIEKMQNQQETDTEILRNEIKRLKELIDEMRETSEKEKQALHEEHCRIIVEKENSMKSQSEELKLKTQRDTESHEAELAKLRAENLEKINELSENFRKELLESDRQKNIVVQELKEKTDGFESLLKELSVQRDACLSKDNELKVLSERIEELNGKIKMSEDANVELKNKMEGLRTQNEERFSAFAQEKQKLKDEIASIINTSANSSDQLVKYSGDLRAKEIEIEALRERAFELENLLATAESKLASALEELNKMKEIVQKSCVETEELKNKLNDSNKRQDELLGEIRELRKNTSAEMETLRERTLQFENQSATVESKLTSAVDELNKSKNAVEQHRAESEELKMKINEAGKRQEELLAEIGELKKSKETEIRGLQERSLQLENQLASTESKFASTFDELNKTKEVVQQYRIESEELQNKINEANKRQDEFVTEITELKTKEQTLFKSVESKERADEELKRKIVEMAELSAKLKEKEESILVIDKKYCTLQDDYYKLEKKLEIVSADTESKISLLSGHFEKSQKLADDLKSENSKIEKSMKELQQKFDSIAEEKKKLEEAMINKNATIKDLELGKEKQIEEQQRQIKDLQTAKDSIEVTLKTELSKNESLSNSLKDIEASASKDARNFIAQLESANKGMNQLNETQSRLELENKELMGKLNQALEDYKSLEKNIKLNQDNGNDRKKNEIKLDCGDSNQNTDHEKTNMKNENEMYKGQIDFLNSVIVDMQRKNETLLCKIEVLEMGVPSNEADDYSRHTLDNRVAAPRMFCDICDQFDLHETEDCPRQAQDFEEPQEQKKSPKKPPVERPYCDNCEIFGHDTADCEDTETF